MLKRPVTQADFDRLEEERLAADRLYNDALTALDRAIPQAPSAVAPEPPPYDEREITPLNESWRVSPEAPAAGGVRGGLARAIWRVVSPWLARQEAFNARLVAHLNENVRHEREVVSAVASALRAVGEQAAALAAFHSRLIVFLQQVTPYVDTKDRSVLGHLALVDEQAINAVADELLRRSEAMQAREARFVADVRALKAAHEEMRSTFATLYQATFTIKRELERLTTPDTERDPGSVHLPPSRDASADRRSLGGGGQADRDPAALDSWKYVGFEDHFRGAREDIRRRLAEYVPLFTGAQDVLDVGCGRGEFLDLLREAGISARGLDPNHEMVEVCRARGLMAEEADALSFLRAAHDGSLGGLFAAQVIEHLEPEYLMRTLEAAYHALRPGSRLVLETINPACWTAFFESYIRDLTHVRAIHPETLQYLLTASGFQQIEIQYRSPLPESERLQTVTVPRDLSPAMREAFETLNENAARLNGRLFSHMDYAAVAVRL
jgi:O-antigen chain-terminating methyltransferase